VWHQLESEGDVASLVHAFGAFHDGCLKEAYVSAEGYVATNLAMSCPEHLHTSAHVLFQRQFKPMSVIELLFEQVTHFSLSPSPEGCDSIIHSAGITLEDGVFLLTGAFAAGPLRVPPGSSVGVWQRQPGTGEFRVAGRRLSWREAPDWLGPKARYGALEDRA
jgi:hypothetical protein